jgi:hypothetical protein
MAANDPFPTHILVNAPVEMKTFASGAKSTVKKPRYDLVPTTCDGTHRWPFRLWCNSPRCP